MLKSKVPEYIVRKFEPSDAESFYAAVRSSIDELSYWMPWCSQDYAFSDTENWLKKCMDFWESNSEYPLGIFDASTGAVIGGTGVDQINRAYRMGNIGYWVSSRHKGQGVARFAARQAALLGFSSLGLTRLEIVVLTHNIASQRVALSLGATLECKARNRLYFQGAPHDAYVYSLVPEDVW